jgi:2-keto-3-deoxy-L-rhamnonate aldolase RhmA
MRSSTKRGAACSFLAVLMITMPATAQQQGQGAPRVKLYNTAKQKLLEGKQVFSFTQSRMDVAGYCESAKHYDYAWIEMQHSTLDFGDVEKMLGACPQTAAIPFIRVPDAQEWHIQHATDVGALGIIVPTVDDADRAREAAKWVRYPPIGRRSSGQGFFSTLWNFNGINYRQTVNENMLLVVMIETPTGVANAYDIASVPGVDVVIVGNNDLTQFSGFAATDERYQQLVTKIHDDTLKAGKIFGQANAAFATGHPLSKDAKFFQNGPSNDGWQPPARAGRGGGGQASPPR